MLPRIPALVDRRLPRARGADAFLRIERGARKGGIVVGLDWSEVKASPRRIGENDRRATRPGRFRAGGLAR